MSEEITSFADLGLSEETLKAIEQKGFTTPTPIQAACIPLLLKNKVDVIGQAKTGTGKTATFGLPILEIVDSLADLIIDGEYVDALNDGSSLKGSSNQTVHYITTRYLPHRELYEGKSRDIQIFISGRDAFLVGVPYRETLETWKEATRRMAEETEEPPGEIR